MLHARASVRKPTVANAEGVLTASAATQVSFDDARPPRRTLVSLSAPLDSAVIL